jgi:hypothetical protein
VSFAFLSIPWALLELPHLMNDSNISINFAVFVSNALAAFSLNMSILLLIQNTSALTMSISGLVKDWMLIGLSYFLFNAGISSINLGGYVISFLGLCW